MLEFASAWAVDNPPHSPSITTFLMLMGSIVNLSVGPAVTVGTSVSPSAAFKAWIGWETVLQYPMGPMTKEWVVRSVVTVVEMALASMF